MAGFRVPGALASILLFASVVGPATAGESAVSWVMRLNDVASQLSYRGSFIYRHGDQIEAMRIVRRVDDDGVMERLYSLNGASREVIRDHRQIWCYLPDENRGVHQSRSVGKDGAFPSLLPPTLTDLNKHYRFRLGETGRIAQQDVQRVDIYPRDNWRYGRMLWVDQKTGLLLRSDLLDEKGTSVEQYMFIEVDYDSKITEADLAPATPKEELVWHGVEGASAVVASRIPDRWAAGELPSGYRLVSYLRNPTGTEGETVHHLVFSDGLATVSVFVDPTSASSTDRVEGESHMGGVNAFGVVIDEHQVTAIGEVPGATVRMIALAMTRP